MIEADRLLLKDCKQESQEELQIREGKIVCRTLEKEKETLAAFKSSRKEETTTKLNTKKTNTWVNMFVDKDTELVKESSKKAKGKMAQESSSKRAGEEQNREVDREDLEIYGSWLRLNSRIKMPEKHMKSVCGDQKVMFKPHVEDAVRKNLQGHKVKLWRLYDSCGVHFVRFDNMHIYMLVKKKYYLTPPTITDILNKKLQADYWNEMCYQLLKLMTKQLKKQ
ncbi:hypothetical protein Tco_0741463 [Tanacetum coccineum]